MNGVSKGGLDMRSKNIQVHLVRPDSPQQLRTRVFRLRYKVYVGEMGLNIGGDAIRGLIDPVDKGAVSFLAELDGEDVGTLRIVGIRDQPLELFGQSEIWHQQILKTAYDQESYCEVGRFMVLRQRRSTNVAMRLINTALKWAVSEGYCEAFIAAKKGRLFGYYKNYYRGIPLSNESTPYWINGQIVGEYYLMRFDLGKARSFKRARVMLYYKALEFYVTFLQPWVKRRRRRSHSIPQKITPAESKPLLRP